MNSVTAKRYPLHALRSSRSTRAPREEDALADDLGRRDRADQLDDPAVADEPHRVPGAPHRRAARVAGQDVAGGVRHLDPPTTAPDPVGDASRAWRREPARAADLLRAGREIADGARLEVGERECVDGAVLVCVDQATAQPRRPQARGSEVHARGGRRPRHSRCCRLGLGRAGSESPPSRNASMPAARARATTAPTRSQVRIRRTAGQRVLAPILTCRWLSWFQSTWTTPGGPVKPVAGPT